MTMPHPSTKPGTGKRFLALLLVLLLLLPAALGCGPEKKKPVNNIKLAESERRLAEAFMQDGKYRAALKKLLQAEKLNENDPELYFDLGTVYLALERPQLAVEAFQKALTLAPDFSPAKNSLGAAYIVLRQWDNAIPIFTELSENLIYATPQFPLLNLGYIYFEKKDYDRAIAYYREAIDYKNDFPQAWRGIGRVYMAQGRMSDAVDALQKAVSFAPKFPEARFELGEALAATGQKAKAVEQWKRLIRENQNSELAEKARRMIQNFGN